MAKRAFDLVVAVAGLVLLAPLLALLGLLVKLESPGPVFHRGWRAGRDGREFRVFRLRTMVRDAHRHGPPVTTLDDPRITALGRRLRAWRLDELPLLLNVVRGDMSLVGPLPEDPSYVAIYTAEQREVLAVRPGISGPAALAFSDEERLLALGEGGAEYVRSILPVKLELDRAYVARHTFWGDLAILVATLAQVVRWPLGPRTGWFAADCLTALAALAVVAGLRWLDRGGAVATPGAPDLWLLPLAALYAGGNAALSLHLRVWDQPALADLAVLALSTALGTGLALAGNGIAAGTGFPSLPPGLLAWGGVGTLAAFVAVRYSLRPLAASARMLPDPGRTPTRTLVYGAGETGQLVAWRLLSGQDGRAHHLLGFLDDDPAKRGLRIHGAAVLGGRSSLVELAERLRADLIVIAVPRHGAALGDIVDVAQRTSARIKLASGFLGGERAAPAPLVREVRVEDLVGRRPAELSEPARHWLAGRSVLVTGACGSIGSELCRQLAASGPGLLHLLDNNESGLYDLELELTTRFRGVPVSACVGDVTDDAKMDRLLGEARPQLVFHVAAYKHVPLMERFPEEAVRVNLQGTAIVLSRAREHGADRFVLISTDKAVHPSSVMGMTKRIAEMMALARPRGAVTGRTLCTAVRFGNVLGSRGSVVPTFARQIELGGPVTVTHPEMTRFFMDVSEAAILILEAAAMTRGGEVFMLQMGERIRIVDIASRMIRLRGLRPELDVAISFSGVRPGEKLHEELLLPGERPLPTKHPLIQAVLGGDVPAWEDVMRAVTRLGGLAARGDRQTLRRELARVAADAAVPAAGGSEVG
jgi:FlaA1/EpsC-like NDP-sugar epimerase/lipopolysaccharide/colanic/teichoic acid biosynthesis glycosyltransferase